MRITCLVLLLLAACSKNEYQRLLELGAFIGSSGVPSELPSAEYLLYCGDAEPDGLEITRVFLEAGLGIWAITEVEGVTLIDDTTAEEYTEDFDISTYEPIVPGGPEVRRERIILRVVLRPGGRGTGRFKVRLKHSAYDEEPERTFIVRPALRIRVASLRGRSLTISQDGCDLVGQSSDSAGSQPPETIATLPAGGTRADAQVAIDPAGNAAAIWTQLQDVYASYRPASGAWQRPELLQKEPPGELGPREPQIVMDAAGNAAAVWEQDSSIWAHAYRAGEGWDPAGARRIGDGRFPRAAMNGQGDLLVVATDGGVVRSRYFRGRDLDESDLADVGQRDPDDPPRASAVALDDNGCGLAVISGRASTQAYELDETGEWGEGDTLATTSAMGFALDVIESKQAAVVWTDEGGAVRASLYDSLGGFGEPVELQNSDATAPSVSLRPDGRAIAVYGVVGADDVAVTANQFIPDLGWSDPRAVGVVASEPVSTDVDSDEDGTSVAVFGNDEESGDYEWRPPTAVIGLPEADPVAGTNANYSGTGSFAHGEGNAIVSYAWDFDADGTRESNDPVAAHAFPNAGLRRVQLEVVDAWGMTGRAVREVEVEEADSGGGFFLTIRVEGEGTVHLAPLDQQCSDTCRIEVPPGTVVDLFPLPDDGSHLGRLTGCDQPDDIDQGLEGCRFTMNGDRTFTVRFEPD